MSQAGRAEEHGTWLLPAGEEDESGGLSHVVVKLAALALVAAGIWWLAFELQPLPQAPRQPQRITILQEPPPPPPRIHPPVEEQPLVRTAPEVALEAPAPRPLPPPVAPPKDAAPPEAPAEPLPQPAAVGEPAPALTQTADGPDGAIAAGTPAPGGSAAGTTGTGAGGGSNPARWDAAYLGNTKPAYPHLARVRGQEGTTLILVLVSPAGLPAEVRLKQSSGSSLLDRSALEAVQRWRFVPAQENGKPVAAWLLIPVVFTLQG